MDLADLHASLTDPVLTSMNLLNEIGSRFPDAISFAPGRPSSEFFRVDDVHRYLRTYARYVGSVHGMEWLREQLFQYSGTRGTIQELIARNLAEDEGIRVDPAAIVVTVGCQEALFLVLRALRAGERDVLLAVSPTYIGVTGAARLLDMPVLGVRGGPRGIDIQDLVRVIGQARSSGQRPRACYVVPDFANPTGASLDEQTRRRLLDVAAEHEFLILEDSPYGFFGPESERVPALAALDRRKLVIHLGSYAKTALPGTRIGYVVADQPVVRDGHDAGIFADELAKIKSMVTINTSPIAQAVLGGKLLEDGFRLRAANAPARRRYQELLHRLLHGLARRFPGSSPVRWNQPAGGFFVVVTTPFVVDDAVLEYSARAHGVLWTPMHHFYVADGGLRQLRLSCSLLSPEEIETGLDKFAALIADLSKTERAS